MGSEIKFMLSVIGIIVFIMTCCIIGCIYDYNRRYISGNQKVLDETWNYKYADVYLPSGGVKTIEIDTWNDYEGEQIQIHGKDGVNYIVSSFNTILRSK